MLVSPSRGLFHRLLIIAAALVISVGLASPTRAHGTEYPLTLENCGRTVTFDKVPERVITTWQAPAELLVKLGLGDRIIGTIWNNQFPAPEEIADEFNSLPVLSEQGASREVLLSAEPDFILASFLVWDFDSASGAASLEEIEAAGINVFGLSDNCTAESHVTIEDHYADILTIGRIFDVQHEAETLVQDMRDRIAAVQERVAERPPVRVFFDAGGEGPVGTAGAGLQDEQIRLAGGENIFAELPNYYESVSLEEISARQPEVFAVDTWNDPTYIDARVAWLFETFSETPAAQNQRYVEIPGIYIYFGSIRLAEGVERLAMAFHPEAFASGEAGDHAAADEHTQSILDDLPPAEPDLVSYPVTVENCGREMTFSAPPERVISLWQPPTEILLALGVADRFVALAGSYAPYPDALAEAANAIPMIGFGLIWPSREILLSQEPDFVISEGLDTFGYDASAGRATVAEIEAAGAQVFSTGGCIFADPTAPARTIDDILTDIRALGVVFGVSARAEALIERMEAQRQHVIEHVADLEPTSVVFYNGGEGPLYVLNSAVWADLLVTAGGENVFAGSSVAISAEEFAAADPEVILVGYFPGEEPDSRIAYLEATFPTLRAVQGGRIIPIATINTENSIRVMQGLEEIAAALHPDAFEH